MSTGGELGSGAGSGDAEQLAHHRRHRIERSALDVCTAVAPGRVAQFARAARVEVHQRHHGLVARALERRRDQHVDSGLGRCFAQARVRLADTVEGELRGRQVERRPRGYLHERLVLAELVEHHRVERLAEVMERGVGGGGAEHGDLGALGLGQDLRVRPLRRRKVRAEQHGHDRHQRSQVAHARAFFPKPKH